MRAPVITAMTAFAIVVSVGACSKKNSSTTGDTTNAGMTRTDSAGMTGATPGAAPGAATTGGAMSGGAMDSSRRMDSLRTDSINRATKRP